MERKINETFEYEGKKLKVVVELVHDDCFGCCFLNRSDRCIINRRIAGECKGNKRNDNQGIIFVDITNEQLQEQAEQPQEEQPQKLNLCEILKHCPKGEMFWSPMLDGVKFSCIDEERQMIIVETIEGHFTWEINADGTISIDEVTSPEIMLYPSREQRDWTKVKYEPEKKRFDPKTLKVFDKVLVNHDDIWKVDFFSHICQYEPNGWCQCIGDSYYICIPYNDETKHLVGTKDEAPDFYKYWED